MRLDELEALDAVEAKLRSDLPLSSLYMCRYRIMSVATARGLLPAGTRLDVQRVRFGAGSETR